MAQIRPKYLSSGLPYIRIQACCLCTKVSGRTRVQVASIPETDNYPTYRLADKMTTTTTLLLPLSQNALKTPSHFYSKSPFHYVRTYVRRQLIARRSELTYLLLTEFLPRRVVGCVLSRYLTPAIQAPAILSLLKLGKVGR